MRSASNRQPRSIAWRGAVAALASSAILVFACGSLSLAAGEDVRSHPGFVDGSFLTEYADEKGEFVEVSLDDSLLKLLAAPAASIDEDAGHVASGLKSVRALVMKLREGTAESVLDHMMNILGDLERRGWQQIAQVREGDSERVFVLIRSDSELILGLTVMVLDGDELVFTNIAGDIRPDDLGRLAAKYRIPGLDQLPEDDGATSEEE